MNGYSVRKINKQDYIELIEQKHYLKRKCSVSFAFGLYKNEELVGVVTYGTPSSPNIAKSFVHEGFEHLVIELNRLYLVHNLPNEASFLISKSLKQLPKPKIVISYADTELHVGTIYKAANFKYLGVTKAKKEWFLLSNPKIHSNSLFSGKTLTDLKKIHGGNLQQRVRSIKLRFAIVIANKKYKHYYNLALKITP